MGAAPREDGPPPPAAVDAPEEARAWSSLWRAARRLRALERPGVRAALAAAAALVALAVIRYPLTVTAECTVLPSQRRHVRAAMDGVLWEIDAQEGSAVKAGQVLARLDARPLEADARAAEAEIARIQANLDRLRHGARPEEIASQKAQVAARESDAAFTRSERDRQQKLLEKGFVSTEGLESYDRDLQVKEGEAAEARAQLRLLEVGARPEEIAALEAELRRAQAELVLARQRLEEMAVIKAPIDGVVVTPKFEERLHEKVAAGDLVCELAGRERMRAEIAVPERELDAVQIGQPVVVKVAAYPGEAFEGTVALVGAQVEPRAGADGVVRVVTEISDPRGLLRPQMSGYGEIRAPRQSLLGLATRRLVRWVRVRFLI